jgi:signal transduction histidine kinase
VVLNFAHLVDKPLADKNIKLNLQVVPVPIVEVPGSRILQVLGNLLDNAENAMPDGGEVNIRLEKKDRCVVLVFSDTGCGISPKDLPHIFEPFYTTRGIASGGDQPCAGLGLSVVHGIIGELGATIKASSQVQKGTTFTMSFPVKRNL